MKKRFNLSKEERLSQMDLLSNDQPQEGTAENSTESDNQDSTQPTPSFSCKPIKTQPPISFGTINPPTVIGTFNI